MLAALLLASATAQTELCTNTCWFASIGSCDDGGPGSEYSFCAYGTDCEDCSPPLWPPGFAPPPPPPAVPPGACSVNGLLFVSMLAFVFLGIVFGVAAMSTPATQPKVVGFEVTKMSTPVTPKLFWLLWLFTLLSWGLAAFLLSPAAHAWLLPEQCRAVMTDPEGFIVAYAIIGALFLGGALW